VTPVIWPAEMLKGRRLQWVIDVNPLYHLLEVARRPLLFSEPATAVNYLVGSGVVFGLGVIAFLVVRLYSRRIVYLL
jgi:homopolymeric O-antigen transport system permease protein